MQYTEIMELDNIIAALDLGSSKVTAVIGAPGDNGEIEILGMGTAPSYGIKNGSIVNIDSTGEAIRKAVGDAELMAGFDADSVYVNITGRHIKGDNSRGVISITNRERIVGPEEVSRVVEAAQAIRLPAEQEIVHVLAREFIVDDQTSIKDPHGMTGVRLESNVHIVTASATARNNLEKAVHKASLSINRFVLSALASAETVLTPGEQELGVALVDIGSGIIDIVVYFEGGVCYTSTIPIGSFHVTQDISIGLKTPVDAAEVLKRQHGCSMESLVDPTETIEVPSVGGRPPRTMLRQELAQIIQPRMKEILELVDDELNKSGKKNFLAGGVVLTGGGSLLEGTVQLAEAVLNLGVSHGEMRNFVGITEQLDSVEYATAAGLLAYGARDLPGARSGRSLSRSNAKGSLTTRFKTWLERNL
jgi:cell division protein FtsA